MVFGYCIRFSLYFVYSTKKHFSLKRSFLGFGVAGFSTNTFVPPGRGCAFVLGIELGF